MKSITLVFGLTLALVAAPALTFFPVASADDALFEFETMVGVPRPFTGSTHAIRGIAGGGAPWVVDEAEARLDVDGELRIEVEGLVLDPDDPVVIGFGLAGVNPVPFFRGALSCLSVDASGAAVTVNLFTDLFPATTGLGAGDSEIREELSGIPSPCIAPIVFVTSPGGSWFAASGFSLGSSGDDLFEFDALVGVPRPFTGGAHAIRGVPGGGLPWVLDEGEAELDSDGELEAEVERLVFDPNDPVVQALGLGNINPVPFFRGVLSCLTVDGSGAAVVVNLATANFPATTGLNGGDSEIEEDLAGVPGLCIGPIVFVTAPFGAWFAASGFS